MKYKNQPSELLQTWILFSRWCVVPILVEFAWFGRKIIKFCQCTFLLCCNYISSEKCVALHSSISKALDLSMLCAKFALNLLSTCSSGEGDDDVIRLKRRQRRQGWKNLDEKRRLRRAKIYPNRRYQCRFKVGAKPKKRFLSQLFSIYLSKIIKKEEG